MSLSWWQRWLRPMATRSAPRRRERPRRSHRPRLEALEDRSLPAVFTVNTTQDILGHPLDSAGRPLESLRQAIVDANTLAGADTIMFAIGSGPQTINVGSTGLGALPALTDRFTLDGTTQPGFAGTPLIELNGASAGGDGLMVTTLTAASSTIRGLVINRFGGDGITITGTNGIIVQGNYLGTDVTGTAALGNGGSGVFVASSSNDTIGGPAAGMRNIISGNGTEGVDIVGCHEVSVQGNYIGTDVSGARALPNGANGVHIHYGSYLNRIGVFGSPAATAGNVMSGNARNGVLVEFSGTGGNLIQGNDIGTDASGTLALGNGGNGILLASPGESVVANVISANGQNGVYLPGASDPANPTGQVVTQDSIRGNFIGTDASGTRMLGNGGEGVLLTGGAHGNTIGGTGTSGNVIAGNRDGVVIRGSDSVGNAIRGNAIFANAGMGIDLGGDGATPNDPGDADAGPNNLQNFPVLTSVSTSGGVTTVQGTLNSTAFGTFTIDFFASAAGDPSGFGEGQTFLGSVSILADSSGNLSFSQSFTLPAGQPIVTATATGPFSNTSEFSQWNTTATALSAAPNPSAQGQAVTFTATVTALEPGAGVPAGTVTFLDGTTALDTETLNGSGQAAFTTSGLAVGNHPITAVYSGDLAGSTSPAVTQVVAQFGTPAQLAFVAQPTDTTAGQAIDSPGGVRVAVEDAFGNVVAGDSSTVTLTLSSGTFEGGSATVSAPASGGVATFSGLVIDAAGTYTLFAADGSLASAVSNSFQITPDVASKVVFTQQPTDTTAGQAVSPAVQVTVEDRFGNRETGDSSTVTLALSHGAFAGGGATATAPASGGVASFANLVIDTAGTYALTATDGALAPDTSTSFAVRPAAAAQLAFAQQPSNAVAGQAIAPAVQVAVEDQFGNLVTTDSSTVTLTLSSGTFEGGSATASAPASGGVATFSGLVIDTAGTYTLSAADGALAPATSHPFQVTPDVASKVVFTQQPTGTTAGQAISPAVQVTVEDRFGNAETGDSSTVTLTLSHGAFENGSSTASAPASGGVATFSGLVIDLAGSYTLQATDGSLAPDTSIPFTIRPDVASKLVFTAQPGDTTAGQAISPAVQVTVEDRFGNRETGDGSTVTLTLSHGTFADGTTTASAPASGGVASFGGLVIDTAGSYRLQATDSALTPDTSSSFTVRPDVAAQLAFAQQPSDAVAGRAVAPAVQVAVEDQFGNLVTTDSSTVTLTLSSGTFEGGSATASAPASGGVATFSTLVIDTAGTYALSASDGSLAPAASLPFTVRPDVASKVVVTRQPSDTTAGLPISPAVQVTVEDRFGNTETGDGSTITLTLSHGAFAGGSATASAPASGGVASFGGMVIDTAGAYALTATDGALAPDTSTSFAVRPAAAAQLAFAQQPSNAVAGQAIAPAVQAAVEDQFGNLVTTDGSTVTVTLSSGTFEGGSATVSAPASGGVATFSGLVIDAAGTYALSASDGALAPATSLPFTVRPDVASKVVFTQQPANTTAGQAVSPAVQVTVEDRFGNTETGDNSTVTLTLSSGTFANGSTTAAAPASGGVATFGGLVIDLAGGYTLRATDGSLAADTSARFTVYPAAADHFVLTAPPGATPGVPFPVTVTALDPFGNTDTRYADPVSFSSSDPSAGLPPDSPLPGGTGTFTIILNLAGPQTVTATDPRRPQVTGSVTVTVGPRILLLDPSGAGALSESGNASLIVPGGGIVVDSTNPAAVILAGNASLQARELDIAGRPGLATSGHATFQGTLRSGVAATADPLTSLPVPAVPAATFPAARYGGQAVVTLKPGTYVGGIQLSGQAAVTLLPGIYYLQGGGLSVSGGASLTGDSVLIYNAPRSAGDAINLAGRGAVALTPMGDGPYRGVVLFQDRTATAPLSITGSGNLSITGTIYAARAAVTLGGNGGLDNQGNPLDTLGSQYVCYDLRLTGSGGLAVRLAPVQPGQSASVGFWRGPSGQALINSFNGGSGSTALANWLAATLPNLYGAGAGANSLAGKTNAQVAAFFQSLPAASLGAEVLATVLNVYATTLSLGGTAARAYGFAVTADGLGAAGVDVGTAGSAFGVADHTTLTVAQILQAVNRKASGGVPYGGDAGLSRLAFGVLDGINEAGGIG